MHTCILQFLNHSCIYPSPVKHWSHRLFLTVFHIHTTSVEISQSWQVYLLLPLCPQDCRVSVLSRILSELGNCYCPGEDGTGGNGCSEDKRRKKHSPLDTLWYGNRSQGSRESPSARSSSGGAAFMLEGEWISMQAGRQWFNVIMSWRNCSWSLSWLATAWPWGCKGLALSQMIESAQHDDYPKLAFIFSSWGLLCFTFSEKIRVLVEDNRLMFCAETGSEQQLVPEQHS